MFARWLQAYREDEDEGVFYLRYTSDSQMFVAWEFRLQLEDEEEQIDLNRAFNETRFWFAI